MQLRALLQQLKHRPTTKNPGVVCILPLSQLPGTWQAQCVTWLRQTADDLEAGKPTAMACPIESIHAEFQTPDTEIVFLELRPPQFVEEADESLEHHLN